MAPRSDASAARRRVVTLRDVELVRDDDEPTAATSSSDEIAEVLGSDVSSDSEHLSEYHRPLACGCSARTLAGLVMFATSLGIGALAVHFGYLHLSPTPRSAAYRARAAEAPHSAGRRWDWALWPPTAERGFAVFDHDGDGRIGEADIVHAAVVKNGERPSAQQVRRYIARADANGDGWLDETEYLALLEMERREKREREAT